MIRRTLSMAVLVTLVAAGCAVNRAGPAPTSKPTPVDTPPDLLAELVDQPCAALDDEGRRALAIVGRQRNPEDETGTPAVTPIGELSADPCTYGAKIATAVLGNLDLP